MGRDRLDPDLNLFPIGIIGEREEEKNESENPGSGFSDPSSGNSPSCMFYGEMIIQAPGKRSADRGFSGFVKTDSRTKSREWIGIIRSILEWKSEGERVYSPDGMYLLAVGPRLFYLRFRAGPAGGTPAATSIDEKPEALFVILGERVDEG